MATTPVQLPLSRLINVAVVLTAAAAQAQNLSTLLILGTSSVIDTVTRQRDYESLTDVGADFGSSTPEYLAAQIYFAQSPQPTTLKIGRWFLTAAAGSLVGKTLSATEQTLANFTAVTSGGFTYTKNGGAPTNVTGINLSTATNLNAVAALISAALTGATLVWNAQYQRFELTSSTTGATSSISFLSAPGSGTDISALLGMTAASSGAYQAPGAEAETPLAAVTLFEQNWGQTWYGLQMLGISGGSATADHLSVAQFIEGTNTKHVYGITTQDAAALVQGNTTNVGAVMKANGLDKTMVRYSSKSPYAVATDFGRMLTVNYNGENTVITMMYKQTPGLEAEAINSTQANALQSNNINVSAGYSNGTAITQYGVMSSGEYIDTIFGIDWLAVTVQTNLYNALYTTTTKIPQTDAGQNLLNTKVEEVCQQGVTNGLLAPGVWNASGFGTLKQGDYMEKGYYVYSAPMRTQNQSDRQARKSMPIQAAAKLAGAIHTVQLTVTVNQ